MIQKTLLAGAMTAALAAPAFAAPVITFSTNTAIPTYTTATPFETFEAQTGGGAAFAPVVNAGAVETKTGDVRVYSASVPGITADPDTVVGNKYLSIEGGGSYNVAFTTPVQFFSFIIGSIDSYNTLSLLDSVGNTFTFSGRQIIGDSAVGPFNSSTAGRVNFDFGGTPGLTSATFSSTQAAFEIDDLAAAVPEPGTWAMMMGGLGLVGFAMRRRRKVTTRVAFAA